MKKYRISCGLCNIFINFNNRNKIILYSKENELYEYKEKDSVQTEQIKLLTNELTKLKSYYVETINYKCEKLWSDFMNNKKWYLHACLHCLLPAIPPPSFKCF